MKGVRQDAVDRIVLLALEEDVGAGDVTSERTVPADIRAEGRLIAQERGIVAGLDVAAKVFRMVDRWIEVRARVEDGTAVDDGTVLAEVEGPSRGILTAERTALNFLQRLSGVATVTALYVRAVSGTRAKILDTRKTTPGLRVLEKHAVRMGGGMNHRLGLHDMVLIKDNHIAVTGGIGRAVERVRAGGRKEADQFICDGTSGAGSGTLDLKVEVETETLEEVGVAVTTDVDRIMLDNMDVETMREAVRIIREAERMHRRCFEVEASGGITLENVRRVAETGVDFISVGALTHSVRALDISLEVARTRISGTDCTDSPRDHEGTKNR